MNTNYSYQMLLRNAGISLSDVIRRNLDPQVIAVLIRQMNSYKPNTPEYFNCRQHLMYYMEGYVC